MLKRNVCKMSVFVATLLAMLMVFSSCGTEPTNTTEEKNNESSKTYNVTWKNYDESIIETQSVEYGKEPTCSKIPVMPENEFCSYVFSGWKKISSKTTDDVIYIAQFKEVQKQYLVTWKNYDGSILATEKVYVGEIPFYDGTPTRPDEGLFSYVFSGWDETPSTVKRDVTYTAQYKLVKPSYTITWKNYDGSILAIKEVDYKTIPSYAGIPFRPMDNRYVYTFSGWDKTPSEAIGDATYIAQYSQTLRRYEVLWKSDNGTVLERDENIEYGTIPTYNGQTPTKMGNSLYYYEFIGWDREICPIESDVIFVAKFAELKTKHKLSFKTLDGSVIEDIDIA